MARRIAVRRARSLKTWVGQQLVPIFGSDIIPVAGTLSGGTKISGGPGSEDVTILRTRGLVHVSSDSSLGTPVGVDMAIGMGLVTTEAAAAGAVPLPFENPDWDGWFVYQVFPLIGRPPSTSSLFLDGSTVIDSKAMRKVPAGQVLFIATQMFSYVGIGGGAVSFSIQARALLKTS